MGIGNRIGLPDDVSVGYVIGINRTLSYLTLYSVITVMFFFFIFAENLLKIQLTRVEQFHSHLEPMRLIKKDQFSEQVIKTNIL